MMRVGRWIGRVLGVCAWLLAGMVLGCGEEEEQETSTQIFCGAVCDRMQSCSLANSGCYNRCATQEDSLNKVREDSMEQVAGCFGVSTCWSFQDDSVFQDCWERAAPVTATEYGRDFCRDFATMWFECGYRYSADECEDDWGMYTDDALQDLLSCASQADCTGLEQCPDIILG